MVRRSLSGGAHATARAPGERGSIHSGGAGAGGIRHRHCSIQCKDSAGRGPGRSASTAGGADRPVVEPRLGSAEIPAAVRGGIRGGAGRLRATRVDEAELRQARAAPGPSEGVATGLALVLAGAEHASRERARMLAVLEHDLATHDDVAYPLSALHTPRR